MFSCSEKLFTIFRACFFNRPFTCWHVIFSQTCHAGTVANMSTVQLLLAGSEKIFCPTRPPCFGIGGIGTSCPLLAGNLRAGFVFGDSQISKVLAHGVFCSRKPSRFRIQFAPLACQRKNEGVRVSSSAAACSLVCCELHAKQFGFTLIDCHSS